jgi:hypothetical protein
MKLRFQPLNQQSNSSLFFVFWGFQILLFNSSFAQSDLDFEKSHFTWNASLDATAANITYSNWVAGGDYSYLLGLKSSMYPSWSNGKWGMRSTWYGKYNVFKSKDTVPRKTEDRLELTIEFGYRLSSQLYVVVFSDLQSQFWPGYDSYSDNSNPAYISNFMAPGFLLSGAALTMRDDSLNASFSITPLVAKLTYVLDRGVDVTKYGVDPGAKVHSQPGAYLCLTMNTEIIRNVTLDTKAVIFADYSQQLSPDLSFRGELTYKVAKYFGVYCSLQALNDDDINVSLYEDLDHDGDSDDFAGVGHRLQVYTQVGISFSIKF